MNEPWSIHLFGRLRADQGERSITRFRTQKTGALLAYMAYHGPHSHPRDALIEIFWPDTSPESGRHNLSHALSSLRHQLEPPGVPAGSVIVADRFSVELNPEAFTTDVGAFEQALRLATRARHTPEETARLALAVEKYGGQLLPGYYEDWIAPAQEHLAQRFQQASAQLIALLEKAGNLERALEFVRRAVFHDPLQEEAQRELIRLLAATARPEAALRQYQDYERALNEVVGAKPGSALRQMVQQIEASALQRTARSEPLPEPPGAPIRSSGASSTASIPLPAGTVTFLLTGLDTSADPAKESGDRASRALAIHDSLMRREFRRNGGQEIKAAGTGFMVVFAAAGDALACVLSCRKALALQPWPEEGGRPRVRMALHSGDVDLDQGEYQGLVPVRAAGLLEAAHGGQSLCSEATASLLRADLDPQIRLKDLGVWRLGEIEATERIFDITGPEAEDQEFPPLNAARAHTSRLPLQFTRFFGREAEIAYLLERLPTDRLITLTGAGGAGKTRLAIEAAGRFSERFSGAIWFVPLADLSDPGLLPQALLSAMNIRPDARQEPLEQVVSALASQPALLLLDNFEQLVEGGAEILQSLLERAPALQMLVTSRQLLGLPGEQDFGVPPLPTPNGSHTPEALSLFDSVRLFVDRAQAVRPDFRITGQNAPAVAELCDRLEGIPLAIELAAARAMVLTPAQMLAQLSNRFEFLVSRKRGVAERQRTLRAALDWSYRLLAPDLQRFFARLSVFRGGWTLEAAEAIGEEPVALDLLAQLRECSLVVADDTGPEIRFRMLETIREYAHVQLSAEDHASAQTRHSRFYLELAERAEAQLQGPEQKPWLNRLEKEQDNLRAVFHHALQITNSSEIALRLGAALWRFWFVRGNFREEADYLHRALFEKETDVPAAVRARALNALGVLTPDFTLARTCHEESLQIRRQIGDRAGIAGSLNNLGNRAWTQGDYAAAQQCYEESLAIRKELGDKAGMASSLGNLGIVLTERGEYEAARQHHRESLLLERELGDELGVAMSLLSLGVVAVEQGDYGGAQDYYNESLAIRRALGDRSGIALVLHNLGIVALRQGDRSAARTWFEESLAIRRDLGDEIGMGESLSSLAGVFRREGDYVQSHRLYREALRIGQRHDLKGRVLFALLGSGFLATDQGEPERGARLCAAAEALAESLEVSLAPRVGSEQQAILETLRNALGEEGFAAAWEIGRRMTWEEAVAYALDENMA